MLNLILYKALDVNVETQLFSELNHNNRTLHQLFRIIDNYGGKICIADYSSTDKNVNSKSGKIVLLYLGALTPFIEECNKKVNYTGERI